MKIFLIQRFESKIGTIPKHFFMTSLSKDLPRAKTLKNPAPRAGIGRSTIDYRLQGHDGHCHPCRICGDAGVSSLAIAAQLLRSLSTCALSSRFCAIWRSRRAASFALPSAFFAARSASNFFLLFIASFDARFASACCFSRTRATSSLRLKEIDSELLPTAIPSLLALVVFFSAGPVFSAGSFFRCRICVFLRFADSKARHRY